MKKNTLHELIDKLMDLSERQVRPRYSDGVCPFELVSTVSRKSENARLVSTQHVPDEVRELWNEFDVIRLFEDDNYGQWGLKLNNESEARSATEAFAITRNKDFSPGDLVVGEFLGDSDLLILRADSCKPDFGLVLIAFPLDDRSNWYRPTETFIEFISSYVKAEGKKFWELHS